jgi:hypothetical protein
VVLKSTLNRFQSFESVRWLKASFMHLIRPRPKLLHMLDDEPERSLATRARFATSNSIGIGRD